jgi:hypothetical protein
MPHTCHTGAASRSLFRSPLAPGLSDVGELMARWRTEPTALGHPPTALAAALDAAGPPTGRRSSTSPC